MIYVVIICALACVGMIAVTLVKPKLKIKKLTLGTYWLVTLLGAALLIAFQFISISEIWSGLTSAVAINPIKILTLFISMTVLSIFLDETGFFRYLANAVLKKMGDNQFKIFTAFFITISIVTVFTSNDVVILTFTPFLCYFAKNAKVDPLPYLVSGFVAANTASMLLIIGNPTNIYLATASGIGFVDYLKVTALPTLLATVTAYAVMLLIFYKKLKTPLIGVGDESVLIKDKPLMIVALCLLGAATMLLAVSSYINIEMWLVALIAAGSLIFTVLLFAVIKKNKPTELASTLKRTPWELIPFVVSMFILVLSLEKYGVTAEIAAMLGSENTIPVYGVASTLFANLVNNIPMSVLFTSILSGANVSVSGVYAAIIGSNIGAFLTPIGALAGIMWLSILKKNDIEFSFVKFIKYGAIIALPVLFAALGGLAIASAWI